MKSSLVVKRLPPASRPVKRCSFRSGRKSIAIWKSIRPTTATWTVVRRNWSRDQPRKLRPKRNITTTIRPPRPSRHGQDGAPRWRKSKWLVLRRVVEAGILLVVATGDAARVPSATAGDNDMGYAKGTGKAINADVRVRRPNPARVAAGKPIPSTGGLMRHSLPVARKPARNKARVA
jgi:hypothetical protein